MTRTRFSLEETNLVLLDAELNDVINTIQRLHTGRSAWLVDLSDAINEAKRHIRAELLNPPAPDNPNSKGVNTCK